MSSSFIRNFVIIAHIDHGKSTLADRFLELTHAVPERKMRDQFLDMHPLERERGITIKMQPVRMRYRLSGADSEPYLLNLIDTPGHVDFSYEVSRALAAVEGAILLVDATQGIQAQTISNLFLAENEGLAVIPVINKIDLPSADLEKTKEELLSLCSASDESYAISAKSGEGVVELLRGVIEKIPAPRAGLDSSALRALIFDSFYDPHQGIVAYVRIAEGMAQKGDRLRCLVSGVNFTAEEVGFFLPDRMRADCLQSGEIGYIATGIKSAHVLRIGDTIAPAAGSRKKHEAVEPEGKEAAPLPGYKEPVPLVFAALFPRQQEEYESLGEALKKLRLNDASLSFEPEDSFGALGKGYRAGFLGTLHAEIIVERLRREYGLDVFASRPSVAFRVRTKKGEIEVRSAFRFPAASFVEDIAEPWAHSEIVTPNEYVGSITTLIHEREGRLGETFSLSRDRVMMQAEMPLRNVITNFHEDLKNISRGFASFSYRLGEYRGADLVRLDIAVAGEAVPAFAEIVPRRDASRIGRLRVARLKEVLPRALFPVALQAMGEDRVLARETIPALRKDVTGYLYGGDRTRKMKLWKKQKEGKKRLEERGRVEIPHNVFLEMMRRSD
jgi:GTP-binding protein LepA